MDIEFLKLDLTPGEKYIGIAAVRYEKRFIFRFKVIPKDDGGYFLAPAAHKVGNNNGKDVYAPAFQLDSSYESDEMRAFILSHIASKIQSTQMSANVFNPPPPQQPQNSYQNPPQQQYYQSQQPHYPQQQQMTFNDGIPF